MSFIAFISDCTTYFPLQKCQRNVSLDDLYPFLSAFPDFSSRSARNSSPSPETTQKNTEESTSTIKVNDEEQRRKKEEVMEHSVKAEVHTLAKSSSMSGYSYYGTVE